MKIYESGENYLETILILKRRNGKVRAVDIAAELDFSKPSVSRAMGILKKDELITIDEKSNIELTALGQKAAEDIYERHNVIARYFIKALGVNDEIAFTDACRIEHIISKEAFEKMKSWLSKK